MGKKIGKLKREEVVIALSVGICLLLRGIPHFQVVTAAITALLVGQTSMSVEFSSGVNRVAATALGGVIGVLVAVLDVWFGIGGLFVLLVIAGILLTMLCCRILRMPEFSDRASCITFILVAMSLPGKERIPYAVYRLLSTLGGALIWMAVAYVVSFVISLEVETTWRGNTK